ncbi:hypothetical protein [Bacteroides sp. 519]|uniref:hypothetical protein n=1 Tax=Bacteroides sp. 519 TaxID=2302937 RepID=UPI0013D820A2|nr:hypothetical protein [Bacteroides sp. 519]NDV59686.1 hypothetical protein [Bacteroides sp. 519]
MKRIEDFRCLLAGPISKAYIDDIVESVHHYPEDFDRIYNLMDDKEIKVSWRATWACEKLAILHPEWFANKQNELIDRLLSSHHDGTKRILLSILFTLPIPEPFPVNLLDYCFNKMLAPEETTGVQALSIKTAYKLCKKEPDLLLEFKMYLENADLDYYTMGVKTTIRRMLEKLS